MIDILELQHLMPYGRERVGHFVIPLNQAMIEFGISDNSLREAAFLAQLAHESGEFRYVEEIASGEAYEGRVDLGNTEPGDGQRYKGRGLIQITGRTNYGRCGDALRVDLLQFPEKLCEPSLACRSAAWYWFDRGLNELADQEAFKEITRRINGGYNGYPNRVKYYNRARMILGV